MTGRTSCTHFSESRPVGLTILAAKRLESLAAANGTLGEALPAAKVCRHRKHLSASLRRL